MTRNAQPTLSRVADSLYWMSRYLERAEHTSRMLDVHQNLMLDMAPGVIEQQRLERLSKSLNLKLKNGDLDEKILYRLTFEENNPAAIKSNITSARENARQIREQISTEMWTELNKLYLHVKQADAAHVWSESPHDFLSQVREGSHLFQGITDATMNHNQGWHFIQLGRSVERMLNLLQLLSVHFSSVELAMERNHSTDRYFELTAILKSVSAFEAYCKVYNPDLQPTWIMEFLLFDIEFPRSVRFCIDRILRSLNSLADATNQGKNNRLVRIAGRLQSTLNYDDMDDVRSSEWQQYLNNIKRQTYMIHDTLYQTYIAYTIESALR